MYDCNYASCTAFPFQVDIRDSSLDTNEASFTITVDDLYSIKYIDRVSSERLESIHTFTRRPIVVCYSFQNSLAGELC